MSLLAGLNFEQGLRHVPRSRDPAKQAPVMSKPGYSGLLANKAKPAFKFPCGHLTINVLDADLLNLSLWQLSPPTCGNVTQ